MPSPELSDDLVGETLLHLPPDDPACLLRASLVCKRWRRILADPAFHRRHGALHRTRPVVGFLHIVDGMMPFTSRFVPNNPASGRPAARELPGWLVLDCRHGRAVFFTPSPGPGTEMNYDFVVWDPLTNEQHRLPRPSPPPTTFNSNVAVLCAATAEGCDHRACHNGPFLVAFIWSTSTGLLDPKVTYARVYSSVTGDWSEPISVQHPYASLEMTRPSRPTRLVGDKLYFSCLFRYNFVYELDAQRLSVILPPPLPLYKRHPLVNVMYIEDDGLGCVEVEKEPRPCLRLWSRVTAANGDGVACWERGRVIELETLLPDGALLAQQLASASSPPNRILGFAEGTDVVFVGIHTLDHLGAVYMVQHNSGRAKKLFDKGTLVVAYTSFCIPVID